MWLLEIKEGTSNQDGKTTFTLSTLLQGKTCMKERERDLKMMSKGGVQGQKTER